MNVLDAVKTRRSIKQYAPDHSLTEQELRTLLSAVALAPTSFNMQNRHIVVVLDQVIKNRLQAAAWGQEQVRDSSTVIVLTGDLAAHQRTERYLRNAPEPVRKQLEPMIADFYEDKDALLRDEACRSVGLAAMSLMLTAHDLGYDTCPIIGFDPAQVSEVLGLDAEHPPLMLVVVGKGTKEPQPRLGLLSFEEQVSVDCFGNHSLTGEVAA